MRKGRLSWIQQQLWDPRQHEFNAGAEALGTRAAAKSRVQASPRGALDGAGRQRIRPQWALQRPARCGAPGATPPSGTGRPGSPEPAAASRSSGQQSRPRWSPMQPSARGASRRQPTRAERGEARAPGWTPGVRPSGPARPRRASPPRLSLCRLPALSGHRRTLGGCAAGPRGECRAGTQSCPRLGALPSVLPRPGRPSPETPRAGVWAGASSTVKGGRARGRGLCGAAGRGERRHLPPGPRTAPSGGAPRGPAAPRHPRPVGGAGRVEG